MNQVLATHPKSPVRRFRRLKRAYWSLSGSVSLGGLYPGRICPSWIRFTDMDMPLPNLPDVFVGKRLVHISDLHCSPLVLERYLRQLLDHVAGREPDFLAVTGDLITGGTSHARRVAELLGELPTSIAKVACPGNHDYGIYAPNGRGHMRQLAEYLHRRLFDAGVHMLRNQHAIFTVGGHALQFVGLEDLWSPRYNAAAAFAAADPHLPTIALSHNPDTACDLAGRGAHWVLAGHTHGNAHGENRIRDAVFPVESKLYAGGYYPLGAAHLYVNRGLSYARRLNLNKRPEITTFTLTKA